MNFTWNNKKKPDRYEVELEPILIGNGQLFHADNMDCLNYLLSKDVKVDLIYIDPPFFTQKDWGQFNDKWQDIDAYLQFMYERLVLMRELLSEQGSIYVHTDWHAGHYVKVLLDELFGKENFRNEIIWGFIKGASGNNTFGRKHQIIFFYRKAIFTIFNLDEVRIAYNPETIARANRGEARYDGNTEELNERGKNPGDVWNDIFPVQGNSRQNTGYITQKPEALLDRIIKASSNENSIVADFFGGSGTTLSVAEKLNRKWIGCDINKEAIDITIERINKIERKLI